MKSPSIDDSITLKLLLCFARSVGSRFISCTQKGMVLIFCFVGKNTPKHQLTSFEFRIEIMHKIVLLGFVEKDEIAIIRVRVLFILAISSNFSVGFGFSSAYWPSWYNTQKLLFFCGRSWYWEHLFTVYWISGQYLQFSSFFGWNHTDLWLKTHRFRHSRRADIKWLKEVAPTKASQNRMKVMHHSIIFVDYCSFFICGSLAWSCWMHPFSKWLISMFGFVHYIFSSVHW